MLSTSLAHLVAHEAYPGHHTEHCRKEVGLVRRQRRLEETIFVVGAPQCLLAEGLADLGLEVICGSSAPEGVAADHLRPLGIPYDAEVAARVAVAGEALERGAGQPGPAAARRGRRRRRPSSAYAERWGLLPKARAEKAVEFQTDPTWRAYIFCYLEGAAAVPDVHRRRPHPLRAAHQRAAAPSDLVAA